jgi:hypothetical protein
MMGLKYFPTLSFHHLEVSPTGPTSSFPPFSLNPNSEDVA